MKEYVDKLGEEYEEYLKHRTVDLASTRRAPSSPTDQVDGPAVDYQRSPDLDDP